MAHTGDPVFVEGYSSIRIESQKHLLPIVLDSGAPLNGVNAFRENRTPNLIGE